VNILQAILLGIVQGITEWLPVSSTAHLVLVPWVLGWDLDRGILEHFVVLVQDGTLLAVVVYFRRDLLAIARAVIDGLRRRAPLATPESRLGWWIVLGTVPGAAAGLALERSIKSLHARYALVAGILLAATALLFLGERMGRRLRHIDSMGARDALWIGVAQAVALLPGVSRSAATISGGLLAGFDRASAARFSFLLSIPIMAGAGAKEMLGLLKEPDPFHELPVLAAGFLAAAVVGYATIHWLLGYLARRPLTAFAWYRIAAGLLLLGLALERGS
jgi:undecaprenyl-diphosphatase